VDISLSEERRRAIRQYFPDGAEQWIRSFPDLLEDCARRWNLDYLGTASEGWPTNLIVFSRQDGDRPVVLKVGYPHDENLTGIIALQAYDGRGAVRVIDAHLPSQALLMERLTPGHNFRSTAQGATPGLARSRVPLSLFNDLPLHQWQRSSELIPSFQDWLDGAFSAYRSGDSQDAGHLKCIALAERLYADLVSRYADDTLLHGDLHHENILMDEHRGWLAIDPKGVTGPHVMECGRFIQNFIEDEAGPLLDASVAQIQEVFETRFDNFAALMGFPRSDIIAATFIDLVVSNTWTLNDGVHAPEGLLLIDIVFRLADR
jgi:streptomycin 6-kinase